MKPRRAARTLAWRKHIHDVAARAATGDPQACQEWKRLNEDWTELFANLAPGTHASPKTWLVVCKQQYERDRNPLCAWYAYNLCRQLKWSVPDWVLEYFDQSAEALINITEQTPREHTAQNAAKALEFVTKGRGTIFSRFREMCRDLEILLAYRDLHILENEKINRAYELLAERFKLNLVTIRRAISRFA